MTLPFVSRRICLSAGRVAKCARFVWEMIPIRAEDLSELQIKLVRVQSIRTMKWNV